jgi:hypothetical protein
VAQDTPTPQDEERRLLTIFEECSTREQAAAHQLLHPHHPLPHAEYMRLADAYQSLRIESKKKWLALRTYRRKMRDDKIKDLAALQSHALPKDAKHPH